ncbi:MAG: hypothetical protein ABSB74_19445 [Tepidisphaeraceae bacterium]
MNSETRNPGLILPAEPMPDRQKGWLDRLPAGPRSIVLDRQWLLLQWGAALHEPRRRGRSYDQVTASIVRMARDQGYTISRSTLFRWRHAFKSDGLFGLVDGRWFRNRPNACWPFIAALSYIHTRGTGCGKPVEFSHAEATKLAEDYDWPRCMLHESGRWIREHLEPSKSGLSGDGLGDGSTAI